MPLSGAPTALRTGHAPQAERIFKLWYRRDGVDCEAEVGKPDPICGHQVLAILDLGRHDPYLVDCASTAGARLRVHATNPYTRRRNSPPRRGPEHRRRGHPRDRHAARAAQQVGRRSHRTRRHPRRRLRRRRDHRLDHRPRRRAGGTDRCAARSRTARLAAHLRRRRNATAIRTARQRTDAGDPTTRDVTHGIKLQEPNHHGQTRPRKRGPRVRLRKQAKKAARKQAAAEPTADVAGDTPTTDEQAQPSTDAEPTA